MIDTHVLYNDDDDDDINSTPSLNTHLYHHH